MQTYSRLLTTLAIAVTCLAAQVAIAAEPPLPRLNVLFIAVDDMNNDLGCYGHPLVKSPNIDRLAARGVRFDRAYCQFPLCSPSRSSLLTGLAARHHARLRSDSTIPPGHARRGDAAADVHEQRLLTARGSGRCITTATPATSAPAAWTTAPRGLEFFNPAGRDKTALEPDIINYTPKRGLGSAMAFLADKPGHRRGAHRRQGGRQTIKLLEEHKDKPFFIGAGFYKPHCPWVTPKKYFDLYPLDEITLPALARDTTNSYPALALASTKPWPYFGVDARPGARVQAGLLRGHFVRRCADRARARRGGPAALCATTPSSSSGATTAITWASMGCGSSRAASRNPPACR